MAIQPDREFAISIRQCSGGEPGSPALVVIPDHIDPVKDVCALFGELSRNNRVYVITSELPHVGHVVPFVRELRAELLRNGVKWATVLGIGAGATVAQSLSIFWPRIVRRLVILDATTRLKPGIGTRIIDKLERFLPLGLPLRQLSINFDSRPFLHRVRCPTLLLLSPDASQYLYAQARYLSAKIPNSWLVRLSQHHHASELELSTELQGYISEFMDVQVKRPQKAQKSEAAIYVDGDGGRPSSH